MPDAERYAHDRQFTGRYAQTQVVARGRGRGRGGRGGFNQNEETSIERSRREEEERKLKHVPIKSAGTFNWGSLKTKAEPGEMPVLTRPLEEERKEEAAGEHSGE